MPVLHQYSPDLHLAKKYEEGAHKNVNAVRGGLDIRVFYPGIAAGDEVRVNFEEIGRLDPISFNQVLPGHDFSHPVTNAETGGNLTFIVPETEMMELQPLNGTPSNLRTATSAVVTRSSTSEAETAPDKNVDTQACYF